MSKLSDDWPGSVPDRPNGPDRLDNRYPERQQPLERPDYPHQNSNPGRPHHLPSPSIGGRYRSLREMSAPQVDGTQQAPDTAPHPLHDLHPTVADPARRRWTRRRVTTLAIVLAIVVLLAGTGGYLGYRLVAPAFGLGYRTGGSTTLDDGITLTVTFVRCGIDKAPNGSGIQPTGSFCTVDVSGFSAGRQGIFVDLRDWHADLDVGIDNVAPSTAAMKRADDVLLGSKNYQLVYDVPTGARITEVHFRVGNATGAIRVS